MWVLFDIDDTLLDHYGAQGQAVMRLVRRFSDVAGYRDESFVEEWHALSDRCWAEFVAGRADFTQQRRERMRGIFGPRMDDAAADGLFEIYLSYYEAGWAPFSDVAPCLGKLAGRRLGAVSNGSTEQQHKKLAALGLAPLFPVVVTSEELGFGKPDPRLFLTACRRLGAEPAACLYVGDRLDTDARAARAAGLTGVWLNRDAPVPADCDVPVIRDLTELPRLLAEYEGAARAGGVRA